MDVGFRLVYLQIEIDVPDVSASTYWTLLLQQQVDHNAIEMQMFALRQTRIRVSVCPM